MSARVDPPDFHPDSWVSPRKRETLARALNAISHLRYSVGAEIARFSTLSRSLRSTFIGRSAPSFLPVVSYATIDNLRAVLATFRYFVAIQKIVVRDCA